MDKIYQRTENGAQTFVDRKTGLGEINEAMMGETKKSVDQMSQISRTDFQIAYRDGRVVRLVLVDAPAPEGYTQGQAVVVQRPGQAPVTGTVAHIHTAPGYVAVRDDRHRHVSNYPTSFVSPAENEGEPTDETDNHVISVRGGKVHTAMPGMSGDAYPLCRGGGMNQMVTKFAVTKASLSCKTCMTYAERRASREGD